MTGRLSYRRRAKSMVAWLAACAAMTGFAVAGPRDDTNPAYRAGSNVGLITQVKERCGGEVAPEISTASEMAKKLDSDAFAAGFDAARSQVSKEVTSKNLIGFCTIALTLYGPTGRDMKGAWIPPK